MSSKTKTAATKEAATPALVPKLRFPGFQNSGEWVIDALGQLADYENGKAYEQDIVENGKYVVVNSRFISTDGAVRKYTNAEYLIAKSGEVLMVLSDLPKGRALAKCYFVESDDRYAVNQRVCRLKPRRIDGKFLYYTLNRHPRLLAYDDGLSQTHLSKGGVTECPLCVPTQKAEQQKIAECLSSVDELMAAQARKLDALKTHKKGLMQQLFPREGETLPRLRFPEFQNAGEWVSKPLGDLGKIITGKTPSTKEADLWGGDILFITPTDISEDSKYQHTAARTVVETKSTKVLPAGSIVYTCIASIGKMALTVTPSITNQQINAVVPNKRALGEFLYYALVNLTPWIKTIPATSTLPIINKTDFSKIAILHPGKAEQQRIATCLSSLDALISAETQKHEALKTHKKGLMQQLFPSPEEVEA